MSPLGPWHTFAKLLVLSRIHWNLDNGRFDTLPFVERQRDLGNPTANRTINPHRVEAVVSSLIRKCDLGHDGLAVVLRRVLDLGGRPRPLGVGVGKEQGERPWPHARGAHDSGDVHLGAAK